MRRKLRAVVRRPQKPDLRNRLRRVPGLRLDLVQRVSLRHIAVQKPQQVPNHLRKLMLYIYRRPRMAERCRCQMVAAWRPADTQVNPVRVESVQNPELLRHLQRRVVRQHDPAAADSYAFGSGGNLPYQYLRTRAAERRGIVVLRDPVPAIPHPLGVPSKLHALTQRVRRPSPLSYGRLVNDAEGELVRHGHKD